MVIPRQTWRCEIISKQLTEKRKFHCLILSDFFHGISTFEFLKPTNRIHTCPYTYVVFSFLWAHFIIPHSTYSCPSSKLNMLLFSEWINYCILLAYMYICMNMCERDGERELVSLPRGIVCGIRTHIFAVPFLCIHEPTKSYIPFFQSSYCLKFLNLSFLTFSYITVLYLHNFTPPSLSTNSLFLLSLLLTPYDLSFLLLRYWFTHTYIHTTHMHTLLSLFRVCICVYTHI